MSRRLSIACTSSPPSPGQSKDPTKGYERRGDCPYLDDGRLRPVVDDLVRVGQIEEVEAHDVVDRRV